MLIFQVAEKHLKGNHYMLMAYASDETVSVSSRFAARQYANVRG